MNNFLFHVHEKKMEQELTAQVIEQVRGRKLLAYVLPNHFYSSYIVDVRSNKDLITLKLLT